MANLTITAADVAAIEVFEQVTLPAAEAIDAGEVVRMDTSTGRATLSNATDAAEGRAIGVALRSVTAGLPVTIVKRGILDVGDALASEDYDEALLLSDTDGKIDDGDGSPTTSVQVGRVYPIFAAGSLTADKALFVDISL